MSFAQQPLPEKGASRGDMTEFLTRFAPSPSGPMHLGHAASALHVWQAAKSARGEVLLRIEDIDLTRCMSGYEQLIVQDLKWLKLNWKPPLIRQTERLELYQQAADNLRQRGLLYRCFKTRAEIADLSAGRPYTGAPLSGREEREKLERSEAFAWRLSLGAAKSALGARYDRLSACLIEPKAERILKIDPGPHGDVVLVRKDTPASYHLACTYDDAAQNITHIIRGEDLREVTHIHVLLQALMDWPTPKYQFHDLILAPDGRKLSKRKGDKGLAAYREDGMTPDDIRRMVGFA